MRRNVLPKFIEICMHGDAMLVPIYMGTNMAAGNQQKHLSSLEELKNNKMILFLIHELFRWPNFPK